MFPDRLNQDPKRLYREAKSSQLRGFLDKYDSGDGQFRNLKYRVGASITCGFGIANGYRYVEGEAVWDSIRIHSGVDRSSFRDSDGNTIPNVVYSPFLFHRSEFADYGPSNTYGSLIRLFNDEYKFELRIAHMDPEEDIEPTVLELLKNNKEIPRNTFLGKSGNYGQSYGAHTHTELVSTKFSCDVLDELLLHKFGQDVVRSYTRKEVEEEYRKRAYWTDQTRSGIFAHYENQVDKRNITGILNPYKYEYKDWFAGWDIRTRYSTEILFNGL